MQVSADTDKHRHWLLAFDALPPQTKSLAKMFPQQDLKNEDDKAVAAAAPKRRRELGTALTALLLLLVVLMNQFQYYQLNAKLCSNLRRLQELETENVRLETLVSAALNSDADIDLLAPQTGNRTRFRRQALNGADTSTRPRRVANSDAAPEDGGAEPPLEEDANEIVDGRAANQNWLYDYLVGDAQLEASSARAEQRRGKPLAAAPQPSHSQSAYTKQQQQCLCPPGEFVRTFAPPAISV